MTIGMMSVHAHADLTGFIQLRQAQRTRSVPAQADIEAGSTMVQQIEGELLYEQRFGDQFNAAARIVSGYDGAISDDLTAVREAFIDWTPGPSWNLKIGRQVLTWGVSDYLYVNDIFPKNYDAFFSGAGLDRIKEPVDAIRVISNAADTGLELVVSRSRQDEVPMSERFAAVAMTRGAVDLGDSDDVDAALRASWNVAGWDVAGHVASFRSREARYVFTSAGVAHEQPRIAHIGVSVAGNFASGVLWAEAAVRDASMDRNLVLSRFCLGSVAKAIIGYSREVGPDLTVSAQLQLESLLDHDRYAESLAPGIRPVKSTASILHLRLESRWFNQTVRVGSQLFLSNEGDSHFNPFANWSPADGWTVEAGANLFSGRNDTRFGIFKRDSNIFLLGRYSF